MATEYYKFPKIFHFSWSENLQNDDRMLPSTQYLLNQRVIVTEKLDGENCVDGNTLIDIDNGKKTIREICENKNKYNVLSLNESGEIEPQRISDFFINDSPKTDQWYEIETEEGDILRLTGSHMVFLPELNCYRRTDQLNGDEKILLKK